MATSVPVFADRSDSKMWSRLCDIEKGATSSSGSHHIQRLNAAIDEVCNADGFANPTILCKLMKLADSFSLDDISTVLLRLIEKCDLSDSLPQLTAAEIFISRKIFDTASSILERITVIPFRARWEYDRGLIDIAQRSTESASDRFHRAQSLDRSFLPVYVELNKLEPDRGWLYIMNIERIKCDMPAKPYGGDLPSCSAEELYGVYWGWEKGNRDGALQSLERMTEYISKDREFLLAGARISRDSRDYASSIERYREIIADPKDLFSISLELAGVYIDADRPKEALELCAELKSVCVDRRLIETVMRAYSVLGNKSEIRRYTDILLNAEYADLDVYVFAIDILISMSMHPEASDLITKLSARCPDEDIVPLLMSKNDYDSQRYPAALSSVSKAIKKMPNDPDCMCQRAKVYLAMGNPKKAAHDADEVLSKHKGYLPAMVVRKDIYKYTGDTKGAYEMCRSILALDPGDARTMKESGDLLESMGKEDEAIVAYREALGVKEDLPLFLDVLTFLMDDGKFEKVVGIVNEYDDIYGGHAEAWVFKGNAEYSMKRYIDASDSFSKGAAIDYKNPVIWHSIGMADEASGDLDRAETAYDKAVLIDLDNPEYWISKASVQEKKEDFGGAISSLNRVISDHPENVFALVKKAMILARLGKADESEIFVDLALQIEPTNRSVLGVKRDLQMHAGNCKEAVRTCDLLLSIDPNDERTAEVLSDAYVKMGRYDEALSALGKSTGQSSDSTGILLKKAAVYHAMGDAKQEILVDRAILEKDTGNRSVMMALADAYVKNGDKESANAIYDQLHEFDPADVSVSMKKARISSDSGDSDIAVKILESALKKDPENTDTMIELAETFASSDDADSAMEYADRAISVDPKKTRPYLSKARILIGFGRYREAQDVLDTAIHTASKTDPAIWECLGRTQECMGDNVHALISYDSAMKMGIDTPELYRTRGRVQEALGMKDAAMNSYSIASIRDPKDVISLERMASMQFDEGREAIAVKYLDEALAMDPMYGPGLVLKATICSVHNDADGVKRIMNAYSSFKGAEKRYLDDITSIYNEILGQSGDAPATSATVHEEPPSNEIIACSERLIRASQSAGTALDDPDTMRAADVPDDLSADVLAYLSDIEEIDVITPEDKDFGRMEELSYNVVSGGFSDDLESEPLISLTTAYLDSGAKSVDEAKRLIAYIYRAVTGDIDPYEFDPKIGDAVNGMSSGSGDIDICNVMKKFHLGVFAARTAKLLFSKRGGSVADHI